MIGVCGRQFCSDIAVARVDFDGEARVVWIDDLGEGRPAAACFLCQRHADRLTAPRQWDLHDLRRASTPDARFADARSLVPEPALDAGGEPIAAEAVPAEMIAAEAVGAHPATSPVWSPHLFPRGDLDGVLDARSPLLARAFGNVQAV